MRSWSLCCLVATALAVGVPQRALGVVFDNFDAANGFININKWGGFETAYRGTEANRRIDNGRLRITARGAGILAPTPTGTIFSDFGLYHPNPNPVTRWQATMQVMDFAAAACPGNTTPGEAWALLRGAFFNSGVPTPGILTNDVVARIALIRRSNAAPNTVSVEAAMFRCLNPSCSLPGEFDNVQSFPMGTLACSGRVCPPVTLRILWESASNRFRFFRSAVGALPALERVANYTLPNANFAGRAHRTLSVAPVPATCTAAAGRKTAFMDATFDNVITNVVNVGPNAASLLEDGLDAIDLGELPGPGEVPIP